jgi:DNA-binding response OmpR family regulator
MEEIMSEKILIVDDEKEMRHLLATCLQHQKFEIDEAASGYDALKKLMDTSYDLILLDVMMPTVDGFEVLKQIREKVNKDLPVVLLTALGETEKVVKGLKLGADDYIVKPFEPSELVARIESVLRRSKRGEQTTIEDVFTIHGVCIEPHKVRASYNGQVISLTKKEFNLLFRLASHLGRVYSREQLLELEWGYGYEGDTRTVDAHIKNIREKLKQAHFNKQIIETVWGIGYQMTEE